MTKLIVAFRNFANAPKDEAASPIPSASSKRRAGNPGSILRDTENALDAEQIYRTGCSRLAYLWRGMERPPLYAYTETCIEWGTVRNR